MTDSLVESLLRRAIDLQPAFGSGASPKDESPLGPGALRFPDLYAHAENLARSGHLGRGNGEGRVRMAYRRLRPGDETLGDAGRFDSPCVELERMDRSDRAWLRVTVPSDALVHLADYIGGSAVLKVATQSTLPSQEAAVFETPFVDVARFGDRRRFEPGQDLVVEFLVPKPAYVELPIPSGVLFLDLVGYVGRDPLHLGEAAGGQ